MIRSQRVKSWLVSSLFYCLQLKLKSYYVYSMTRAQTAFLMLGTYPSIHDYLWLCAFVEITAQSWAFPGFLIGPIPKDYLRGFHRCWVNGAAWSLSGGQTRVFSGMFVFVRQQGRSWGEKEIEDHQHGAGEEGERTKWRPQIRQLKLHHGSRLSGPLRSPISSHSDTDLWHSMVQNLSH